MNEESDKFTWDELDLIRYFLVENKKEFTEFANELGDDDYIVDDILAKLWEAMDRIV